MIYQYIFDISPMLLRINRNWPSLRDYYALSNVYSLMIDDYSTVLHTILGATMWRCGGLSLAFGPRDTFHVEFICFKAKGSGIHSKISLPYVLLRMVLK